MPLFDFLPLSHISIGMGARYAWTVFSVAGFVPVDGLLPEVIVTQDPRPIQAGPLVPDEPTASSLETLWISFESDTGRFSALFPETPRESLRSLSTSVGEINLHEFSFEDRQRAYLILYADYPSEALVSSDAQQILDLAVDNWLEEHQAEAIERQTVQIAGHPGRAVRYQLVNGLHVRGRAYLVGDRLYQIFALYESDGDTIANDATDTPLEAGRAEADAVQFVNSFRLAP